MYVVYIIKSIKDSSKNYVGITKNLEKRIKEHNSNESGYTKRFTPWKIETYITFKNKPLAEQFEKYLKAGSGQAFLKKHLI